MLWPSEAWLGGWLPHTDGTLYRRLWILDDPRLPDIGMLMATPVRLGEPDPAGSTRNNLSRGLLSFFAT